MNENRVAVITGGGRGLGRAFAERLALDGFDIAIADVGDTTEVVKNVKALGRDVFVHRCDISSPDEVNRFHDAVIRQFSRCDVVLNNAGIFSPMLTVEEMSFDLWRKMMSINLDGTFLVCRAFIPDLKMNSSGRIINLASGLCWGTAPEVAHYTASKMGVIGLTRGLANELAEFGVTANIVAPGYIETEGTTELGKDFSEVMPRAQVIKRLGQPDDMVGIVSFLASDDSRFATGQTFLINGGVTKI